MLPKTVTLLTCLVAGLWIVPGAVHAQLRPGSNSQCSEAERNRNVEEHQRCFQTVQSRFQTTTAGGSSFCDHMHEQVNKCSEIFTDCETTEDIR